MPLTLSGLQKDDLVHLYQRDRCAVRTVDRVVIEGRHTRVLLDNDTMINRMTIQHYHLPDECPHKGKVTVRFQQPAQREWKVPSNTEPGKEYTVQLSGKLPDGQPVLTCNCIAGTYSKPCAHAKKVRVQLAVDELENES